MGKKNLNVTFHLISYRDRALNLFATGKQDLLIFQQVIHHNLFKKWHREFMFVSKSTPSFCLPKTYRMKREVIKLLPWTKYLAPVLPYMISITKKKSKWIHRILLEYWNLSETVLNRPQVAAVEGISCQQSLCMIPEGSYQFIQIQHFINAHLTSCRTQKIKL